MDQYLLLENHSSALYEPGRSYLLIDHCNGSYADLHLVEGSSNGGRIKFRGKFQEADAENKNKRIYPFGVLDENVQRLQEAIQERKLVGELDHPTDSIVHFTTTSHIITKLWWEGNNLMGEGEILNTPHGKVFRALIDDGVKVGISSRGVGNGKVSENGTLVIGEGYKLITFDVVADPSTYNAYQSKVNASKKENVIPAINQESSTKNEGTRIHKVNKDLLIACVGGLIHSETRNLKSRLK